MRSMMVFEKPTCQRMLRISDAKRGLVYLKSEKHAYLDATNNIHALTCTCEFQV